MIDIKKGPDLHNFVTLSCVLKHLSTVLKNCQVFDHMTLQGTRHVTAHARASWLPLCMLVKLLRVYMAAS